MEEYSVGDVLRFRVWGFSHLALYIGNGRIVHFWSESGFSNFTVRENTIQELLEVGSSSPTCYTNTLDEYMGLEPFSRDMILKRAREQLGAKGYNLVMNNCEHFVTWVRYGRAVSPQIRSSAGTILGVGVAVCGVAVVVPAVAASGALPAIIKRQGKIILSAVVWLND